jgi:general secretion pathway protein G
VVVVIIALLLALLLPAIQKARVIAQEAEARNEMSQLTAAATAFKNEWGAYPPSLFRLPTKPGGNVGANAALEDASYLFLKQKYNRWTPTTNAAGDIIWDANMAQYLNQTLAGNQSMTFFLGGPIRVGENSPNGWAHDQPTVPSTTANSKMFFLEMKAAKLETGTQYGYGTNARVYMDPFGTPYVYFGSNKVGGKYTAVPAAVFTSTHPEVGANGTPSPYMETGTKFANQDMCQIISAGPDNRFGAGGTNWSPTYTDYVGTGPGADDMANFNGKSRLGVRE